VFVMHPPKCAKSRSVSSTSTQLTSWPGSSGWGSPGNGTRVAIIEPAEPNPLSGLIESGDLRPGLAPLPLFSDSDVSEAADSVGLEAILEDRYGTARW